MDDIVTDAIGIHANAGEHVVMMSLEDFNSMEETMYLLSSHKNAQRLMESIAQIKAAKAQIRELLTNEQTKISE